MNDFVLWQRYKRYKRYNTTIVVLPVTIYSGTDQRQKDDLDDGLNVFYIIAKAEKIIPIIVVAFPTVVSA